MGKSYDLEMHPPGQENQGYVTSNENIANGLADKPGHAMVADESEMNQPRERLMVQSDFKELPAPDHPDPLSRATAVVVNSFSRFFKRYKRVICYIFAITLALLYFAYFGYAMYVEQLKNEDSIRLLWMTCAVVFFVIIYYIKRCFGDSIEAWWDAHVTEKYDDSHGCQKAMKIINILVILLIIAGVIAILVVLVALRTPNNLISLAGMAILLIIGYIGSTNPARIQWRPILVGLLLQFILALLILKTNPGYQVFKFLGDRTAEFLAHTSAGSNFVFDPPGQHLASFAFAVLPIVIFFSTIVSILYYLGVMQMIIAKVAWLMQILMGTTVGESLNAAGNIFVGMTEAPLIIRPFIGQMTNSELHAVMTGGFATIAGSVMGAFISFGVPANHLISASVMSAPAALAMAKLFYPETKESETTAQKTAKMEKSPYKTVLEAACGGAITSIKLVANIAVVLIAFLAVLDFLNQTLTWFGKRAGMTQNLTFQFILSYALYPLAYVMGVMAQDCRRVAELIGVKTILNEYIAYSQLAAMIKNRISYENLTTIMNVTNPTIIQVNSDIYVPQINKTFTNGFLFSRRSEVIATYSLCGFANIGSIGILLGSMSGLAPHRARDMAGFVTRAMIAGNVACFLTACIAGLFYDPNV